MTEESSFLITEGGLQVFENQLPISVARFFVLIPCEQMCHTTHVEMICRLAFRDISAM